MKIQQAVKLSITVAALIGLLVIESGAMATESDTGLSIGERFHKETSITSLSIKKSLPRTKSARPARFKEYPGARIVKLPKPDYEGDSLEEALKDRRSIRDYSREPLALDQLSQLLFAAQGITGKKYGQTLRTTPSAGALYPFEIYIVVNNVKGLTQGIYHYAVIKHALELIKVGNFKQAITNAGMGQKVLGNSGVTFVLSAIFDRTRHKYSERGYRYAYLEAGHISQNIYLQSVSLGLGSVGVGGFNDEEFNKLIGVDGESEAAIHLHAVGSPR